ncbi:Eco57I restriction-modification methylase domain-containing protein [Rhodococcus sp. NPDC078407]|uniref:Eco57I restriction-modification methylase domain-containing protein n=1 Tax=unclassified Rhodococcus (in: high G+C Gram-positive bacteria) TaxID=192944 RepID=UPI0024B7309A|nr:DNA methyltransferase [Rhodococcus sp. IEGM 1341]MDI9928691.1 SAM-dependent DNA methyltransferase [Rhodococcus sp. IEGM 1341]
MTPTRRRPPRTRTNSNPTEWLELLAVDGPFLAAPVAMDVWPGGLPAVDKDAVSALRDASSALDASPGTRDAFIRHVLVTFLGWKANHLGAGHVPSTLNTRVAEFGIEVRPDLALVSNPENPALQPLLLGMVVDPGVRASARSITGTEKWPASPVDRLAHVLRAHKVPLGLVTDGTEWTLVCAPEGGATTTATWTRHTWFDEPDTLKAFAALLGRLRFFGVPDEHTLPALLAASMDRQEEITTRLSEQSRAVVEMLVACIGRLDANHKTQHGETLLPAAVEPAEVYQGAVTVLMRLVFLLYAEERGLLPVDDNTYADGYAISTLAGQLREHASDVGEDTLERSSAAWHRLLGAFRAVHRGARHEQLALPGYGGSLFDPDRFPWLEGRRDADTSLDDCDPLPIDDRTLLRALEALQWLRFAGERRRVSFRVLDVEQIGYVYEGLLDQDARRAPDWILGIAGDSKGEKDGPEIALTAVIGHFEKGIETFAAWLSGEIKEVGGSRSSAAIKKSLATPSGAASVTAWTAVLEACGGDELTANAILPFAGLLRRDPRDLPVIYSPGSLYLTDSDLRAHTGAVYTPRALAEQVVARTLEPLVKSPGPLDTEDEAVWKIRTPEQILAVKVVDIAAGSGAFLVAATRYLADRLLDARRIHEPIQTGVEVDDEQAIIDARRQILDHCIYGVDINPMALEMAKLSLWLVTLDRNRPFGFLDDRLAVGDSLLGLTSPDQLLEMHLDPRGGRAARSHEQIAAYTADVPGLLKEAAVLRQRISDVELIDSHSAEHKTRLLVESGELTRRFAVLADALSGASLSGGAPGNYGSVAAGFGLATSSSGSGTAWTRFEEEARFSLTEEGGQVRRPAHFPLLFPEVFTSPQTGFDAVVGNPPFLGGSKLTGAFGAPYREHLVRAVGRGVRGNADLIAYMFLTATYLCNASGSFGLIATNTVAQGDTREIGLDQIAADDWDVYAAVKSEKWPTKGANLQYSVVWASRRGRTSGVRANADGLLTQGITPSLDPLGRATGNPFRLTANRGLAFSGSKVDGLGFTMSHDAAQELIRSDQRSTDVLFPYINGEDLNTRPDTSGSRWAINFFGWTEEQARQYPDCYEIVRELVKPVRDQNNRESRKRYWWRYAEHAPGLYKAIEGMSHVLAITLVSKVVMPVRIPTGQVFAHRLAIFATEDMADLALLSSAPHYWWAIKYSSTLESRINYTPSDVFETLPRPTSTDRMRAVGEAFDRDRRKFMSERQLGLTDTYNLIHDPAVADIEVTHLRALHVNIDEAVLTAYGWDDLPLDHDHYDTRQGVRWSASPAARLELVDRLLELNQTRYAEERAALTMSPLRSKGRIKATPKPAENALFDTDEDV